jgi:hypothetical protein
MSVLYFASVVDGIGGKLEAVVESLVPMKEIEVYRKLDDVTHRLRQYRNNLTLAVIFAANQAELANILSLGELLRDLRVILVLPDRERDTIKKGHTLRPRYLAYADGDFSDVAAVLNKMLGIQQNNKSNKRGGS